MEGLKKKIIQEEKCEKIHLKKLIFSIQFPNSRSQFQSETDPTVLTFSNRKLTTN